MTEMIVTITVLAHLVVPLVFLVWLARSRATTKVYWASLSLMIGSYLILMWLGGAGWSWFGYYWPVFFLATYFVFLVRGSLKRAHLPMLPEQGVRPLIGVSFVLIIGLFLASGIPSTLTARRYPKEKAIELNFPLTGGTFHVGHGGSNATMNAHNHIRAQQYALDIVKLGPYGIRAQGLLPSDVNAYAIYGSPVVAPCSGDVLAARDDLPDLVPPNVDTTHITGNHIILFCGGASVVLAHLKQNSLKVKAGDAIGQDHLIAQVGNSGNTSEPHLHIHAVAGRHVDKDAIAVEAEGIPMLFMRKFLIRNDRVEN